MAPSPPNVAVGRSVGRSFVCLFVGRTLGWLVGHSSPRRQVKMHLERSRKGLKLDNGLQLVYLISPFDAVKVNWQKFFDLCVRSRHRPRVCAGRPGAAGRNLLSLDSAAF